jgi:hypothetical protein
VVIKLYALSHISVAPICWLLPELLAEGLGLTSRNSLELAVQRLRNGERALI